MTITLSCLEELAKWLAGDSATAPTHIAVGSDNTSPDEEDTGLIVEIGRKQIDGTAINSDQVTFTMTVLSSEFNGQTLREAGLFNDDTAGDMFCRNTNSPITKTSNLEVVYEIKISLTN